MGKIIIFTTLSSNHIKVGPMSKITLIKQDAKSKASLLFFWYAEVELTNNSSESLPRALHILCCLGCGVKYSPFKSQPSSLQLLRARQGFKEQVRMIQATWMRGIVDANSVASVCSASLFEELTTGWEAAVEVINQALSTVLPGYLTIFYTCGDEREHMFNIFLIKKKYMFLFFIFKD